MEGRVLPKTLDYTDVLPLAVESRSRRRTFFPINGQTFQSGGANIIRIDLSADALLDTQHSYLRFSMTPQTRTCGIDYAGGHAFIKRLRVEQSGVVLEDINSYNRLMGAIVLPCQSGDDHHKERSLTEGQRAKGQLGTITTTATQDQMTDQITAANTPSAQLTLGRLNNKQDQIALTKSYNFCIPLSSGILNNEKLIPLMLMSAPLTIEIELAPSLEPVIYATDNTGSYDISNVRYIANLIEVGQDVAGQLRMVQEMSGGVLTLAGQTYRHFTGAITGTTGDQIINVPARVKSMKSLFFASGSTGASFNEYDVGHGGNMKLDEYQLKIGSVVYPPTPIKAGFGSGVAGTNGVYLSRSEVVMELAKAWGNVGSTKGLGQLDSTTAYTIESTKAQTNEPYRFAPFGMDLEAFQRVAIESGVNTADRSLPISLILGFSGGNTPTATNVDVFVLADALFYINGDGSMSVSV
tara:strand:- start:699 stop:2099 length:1401 start_codon:yes stop_codon:yes gene_type:complete